MWGDSGRWWMTVNDSKAFWQGTSQWRFVIAHDGAVSRPGTTGAIHSLDIPCLFVRLSVLSTGDFRVFTSWLSIHMIHMIYTQHPPQVLCFNNLQNFCTVSLHMVVLCYIMLCHTLRDSVSELSKRDIIDTYWIQSADGASCCVHLYPVYWSAKQLRLIIGFAELAGESKSCIITYCNILQLSAASDITSWAFRYFCWTLAK